jgi:hypothetical protein
MKVFALTFGFSGWLLVVLHLAVFPVCAAIWCHFGVVFKYWIMVVLVNAIHV